MNDLRVWPRMDIATAEVEFRRLELSSGPEVNLEMNLFDLPSVGVRNTRRDLQEIRSQLVDISSEFGFDLDLGYSQETFLDDVSALELDRAYAEIFRPLTPMMWSDAGDKDVWSWFALAFLPDLTHWRWVVATRRKSGSKSGEWYKARWIGGDMSRHTWARLWWRNVQFAEDPELMIELSEHDLNHLLERADSIGANPKLISSFGEQLLELSRSIGSNSPISRRAVFDDSAKRMLRKMAFIDLSGFTDEEMGNFVREFIEESKAHYLHALGPSGHFTGA